MAVGNVDLEYLASLSPPINIFPISNIRDSIKSRIKNLEKYYNEFYVDDGNIPYNAKMARTLGNHHMTDTSQHEKKRNAANQSRTSRDKVRFVTARTADDSKILSTIFTTHLDYIIALEKDMNVMLIDCGHDPVNIIELLDIEDNSKKLNGVLFDQILSGPKNVLTPNEEYWHDKQTEPIDYSIPNDSLHHSSSEIDHQLDKCSVYSSNESNVTDEMNAAEIYSTPELTLPTKSMAEYLKEMRVTDNQSNEFGLLLNICDQMVNLHMASYGKGLHQWK